MTETPATAPLAPPPAPGAERHPSLDFANSALTLAGGQRLDLLDSPPAATRWLVEHGLAPEDARLWDYCTRKLRALREQIRVLITARIDGTVPAPAAVDAVNEALTRVPTASLLHWDPDGGPFRTPSHPATQIVDHALAVLAADAAELLTTADAERLTACGSPPCNRFLVRTHPRRHWCSVRCGDRARAARAYARRARAAED
ncbi:CGNR zinc finger domain-containing protein [Nocardiopsis aegyptia]|uniref:Putative RNA-binding Zn ribbon-like protein n=1 Tax=Nocardiopsis aegyptia TaxID=220378 RepID=A0A7Z0JAC6_9ACTN|nr:ABATE domain-containing protein [Nocardiopsis aegyptia]NYJ34996.1 putative RNA-binding Zn ribbon-like protein [Nocardiopsis aegyptia]